MIDIAIYMLLLHGPDGRDIHINVDAIATVRCKTPDGKNDLMDADINAIINTNDGKHVSVVETCDKIKSMLQDYKKYGPD